MLTRLCYFNVFLTPFYFLLYFQNTTDYYLAAGFILLIPFSVLLIRAEERIAKKPGLVIILTALAAMALLFRQIAGTIDLLSMLELSFLEWRTGIYLIFTVVFCIVTTLQLFLFCKKYVLAGIVR